MGLFCEKNERKSTATLAKSAAQRGQMMKSDQNGAERRERIGMSQSEACAASE